MSWIIFGFVVESFEGIVVDVVEVEAEAVTVEVVVEGLKSWLMFEITRFPWRLNVVPEGAEIGVRFARFGTIVEAFLAGLIT